MNKTSIALGMFSGLDLGIIVALRTGVFYSNQADGVACIHPELEGAYIPIGFDLQRQGEANHQQLADHFLEREGNRGCITRKDADFIDNFLLPADLPFTATVDRNRLGQSYEAWVWLNLTDNKVQNPEWYTSLPAPLQAVLVWPNSD